MNAASDELEDAHEQYVLVLTDDDEKTDAASYLEDEIKRTRRMRKEVHVFLKTKAATSATPTRVILKPIEYPVFEGKARKFHEWKQEYESVIKPRLCGASDAAMAMCLKNCLSKDVKTLLAPDCKSEKSIMKELERQYGVKDRIITQILEDVMKVPTPSAQDSARCATFYHSVLCAVNDLSDLESENCLKNPAIILQIVRKLPLPVRDKWWETIHSLDGADVSEEEKPDKFIKFIKWQLEVADEMATTQPSPKPSHKAATRVTSSSQGNTYSHIDPECKICSIVGWGKAPPLRSQRPTAE